MPEKEPQEKIRRIFGLGRLSSMLPRSLTRKSLFDGRHDRLLKILLLLGLSLAITITLTPRGQRPLRQYKVGDIAEENIKALGTFLVEDVDITAQRKRELLASIPPVFDLDEEAAAKAHERLRQALEFLRRNYQELSQQKVSGEKPNAKAKIAHPRFPAIYKALLAMIGQMFKP